MIDNSNEFNRIHYNLEKSVKVYGNSIDEIKLWNSEEIIFDKYINTHDKILDLGCGAGRTTINLYRKGYNDIVGVDIADKLIEYAIDYCKNNNLNIDFELGDATNLRFEDNTFDVVIFSFNGMQCIPGIENRMKVLHEVARVLKPNGLYIFTAHDRHDPYYPNTLLYWEKVESEWRDGIRYQEVESLGDMIALSSTGEEVFVHLSTIDEIKEFISHEEFDIVEYKHSYDIAHESEKVLDFADYTVFWILRKR